LPSSFGSGYRTGNVEIELTLGMVVNDTRTDSGQRGAGGAGRPCERRGGAAQRAEPQTSSAVSTTSRSLASCSSSVSALPSTVDEKPHWGERQS
jgi:hypothetical protein